jgi:HK97 gp10 family phage protein
MSATLTKYGDWSKAGAVLQGLNAKLIPAYKAQLQEDGELILKTLQGHIDNQDLNWTPLSEHTVELKHGDETIYVETGYLRDNLAVRKVRSSGNNFTLFIGASAWKRTPSGVKFSDLMIWLEYGTSKMPPRPLIRPTMEEMDKILRDNWQQLLANFIDKGGSSV